MKGQLKKGVEVIPSRENCVYTSCYCEENVWKLCEFIQAQKMVPLDQFAVIFISNDTRTDYHVILLKVGVKSDSVIYDLDSVLPFPCSLRLYAAQALRSDRNLRPEYHRKLRVVPANSFLLNFASDRSHMRNSDGTWKMPPPSYPPIFTAESKMNLDDFISMNPAVGWGTVYTLDHFLLKFVEAASTSASSSTTAL
uniref:Protein N-terminal glutamine amidohydrolase n=1 Tax=Oryzias latipes TaxID=8090 RepID=A0A3B3HTK5_ORYLA